MRFADSRAAAHYLLPPLVIDGARWLKRSVLRRPAPWEYVPEGWKAFGQDPKIKGWDEQSIVEAYGRRWPAFAAYVATPLPLAVGPEHDAPAHLADRVASPVDVLMHNVVMGFAFALACASRRATRLSLLDWGGGPGHYYLVTRALLPDAELEYHCRDLAGVVAFGERVLPEVHFHRDEECLDQQYDLVFASASFQYVEDWRSLLGKLVRATGGYLFVTQLPVVHHSPSFVIVQRPYSHGYDTEYLGWCLNRRELLDYARQLGLILTREFVNGFRPPVKSAPEPAEYRGFLFRRAV